jgi:hypothetical protein
LGSAGPRSSARTTRSVTAHARHEVAESTLPCCSRAKRAALVVVRGCEQPELEALASMGAAVRGLEHHTAEPFAVLPPPPAAECTTSSRVWCESKSTSAWACSALCGLPKRKAKLMAVAIKTQGFRKGSESSTNARSCAESSPRHCTRRINKIGVYPAAGAEGLTIGSHPNSYLEVRYLCMATSTCTG